MVFGLLTAHMKVWDQYYYQDLQSIRGVGMDALTQLAAEPSTQKSQVERPEQPLIAFI